MGSSNRSQTTTSQVQYPDWLSGPMQDNIARTNALADQMGEQGYQGYDPAQRVAPMNQWQQQALMNAGNSMGQWSPIINRANTSMGDANSLAVQAATNAMPIYGFDAAQANSAYSGPSAMVQAQSFLGGNIGGYMNPYTQHVTNNALGQLEEQRQVQNVYNSDAATKARAFGGARHGLVEAQTNTGFAKQAGDLALNAAQNNFMNAQQAMQTDMNRNLQGQLANQQGVNQSNQFNAGLAQQASMQNAAQQQQAAMWNAGNAQNATLQQRQFGLDAAGALRQNALGDQQLASMYQNLGTNDINNLMTAGNMMQDQDQMGRDFAYQEFLNQQNFPRELLNMRYGAVSNTPYQPGTSSSTPVYRNRTQGFLGGAGQAYGATGNPWLAALGGILGAWG